MLSLAAVALPMLLTACAPATGDGSSFGDGPDQTMTENANDGVAFQYFVSKGLRDVQAAGIVGNLDEESGMIPTVREVDGGPGRGIAQWKAGGRWDSEAKDNVVWYTAAQGGDPWSLKMQLDFIWYELTTYDYGLSDLKAAKDVEAATLAFMKKYEMCAGCDPSNRIAHANAALAQFGGSDPDSGSDPDPTPTPDPPPGCGVQSDGLLHCTNLPHSAMYAEPTTMSMVVDYLELTNSWFKCWGTGDPHSGGNTTWFYTQGDDSGKWGWVPAVDLDTDSIFNADPTNGGLPVCDPQDPPPSDGGTPPPDGGTPPPDGGTPPPGGTSPSTSPAPTVSPDEGSQAFLYPNQDHFLNGDAAGNIRHHRWDSTTKSLVTDTMGTGTAGRPVALVDGTSEHVFARGKDGSLQHWFWDPVNGNGHDNWAPSGGLTGDPTAIMIGDFQDVWAIDGAGLLLHWWWGPSSNGVQHDNWGSGVIGRPSVLVTKSGEQHAFARGTGGTLEHWWWAAGAGISHDTWGSGLAGDPAALTIGNFQDVWGVDGAGNLQHWYWGPSTNGVQHDTWGSGAIGRPSVFVTASGEQHVFARGTGGTLEHWWWAAGLGISHDTWGTGIVQDPTAEIIVAQLHVWALDAMGHAQHWYLDPSTTAIQHDDWGQ